MREFRISRLQYDTVLYVYSERQFIQVDPDYQRQSDIWPLDKRQLLIDSLINGYDIPKIYFHEFRPPVRIDEKSYKYAIIDGKQRLQSIWNFIDGRFALSDTFEYYRDSNVQAAGLSYAELADRYPLIKMQFDSTSLSVVTVQTDEIDLIEDMFSRLNEAAPLNAAEKRNALGGPIPFTVRRLTRNYFFTNRIPFSNSRYKHYEVITKILYLEYKEGPADTKKAYLDDFVMSLRGQGSYATAKLIEDRTLEVLERMSQIFVDNDRLLRSVGMVTLYYLLFREAMHDGWIDRLNRQILLWFEELRLENRMIAEDDITGAQYRLLEFDRLAGTPNDEPSIRYRFSVLRVYVASALDIPFGPLPQEIT